MSDSGRLPTFQADDVPDTVYSWLDIGDSRSISMRSRTVARHSLEWLNSRARRNLKGQYALGAGFFLSVTRVDASEREIRLVAHP